MSIILWRVLCVVSAALFVIGLIVLLATRLLRNKFYHVFNDDELLSRKRVSNGTNSVYFTSGETKNYINKYAICKTEFDKYLVCKFVRRFSQIRYFVIEYTSRGRAIAVQQIEQFDTSLNSKVITLHRRCAKANIVVSKVDDMDINTDVIRPLSRKSIRVFALIKSFTMFAFLFAARHIIFELSLRGLVEYYLNDTLNYISIAACFVCALLSYLITVLCYRRKNVKALNGGAVEYEFV